MLDPFYPSVILVQFTKVLEVRRNENAIFPGLQAQNKYTISVKKSLKNQEFSRALIKFSHVFIVWFIYPSYHDVEMILTLFKVLFRSASLQTEVKELYPVKCVGTLIWDALYNWSFMSSMGFNLTGKHFFPQGSVKHLQLQDHELRDYEQQLESVLRRYLRRLQWLLGASRRTFGAVIEKKVTASMNELRHSHQGIW